MCESGAEESAEGIVLQHGDLNHLSSALLALQETGCLCDLVIRFENAELFAHACVLAACSPVLKAEINTQKQAGDEFTEISSKAISHDVWNYILRFMYTSQVFLPTKHQDLLPDIAQTAQQLQLDELYEVASEYQTVLSAMNDSVIIHPLEEQTLTLQDEVTMEEEQMMEEVVMEEEQQVIEEVKNIVDEVSTQQLIKEENPAEVEEEANDDKEEDEVVEQNIDDNEEEKEVEVEVKVKTEQDNIDTSLHCTYCSYKAKTRRAFERHCVMHEKEHKLHCTECNQSFSTLRGLKQHSRFHSNEQLFKCQLCSETFQSLADLREHRQQNHSLAKQECPVQDCPFITNKRSALKTHLASIHPELSKPFQCSKCDYAGETSGLLQKHFQCHFAEHSYECSVCDRKFKRQRDLVRHHSLHSDDGKIQCTLCDRKFNRNAYLNDHMRRDHKQGVLVCPVEGCGLEFRTYDQLYRHKRVVHDNKQFVRTRRHMCTQCGQVFFSKSHLITHEHAHNNERPFSCEICGKSFLQKSDLTKHSMIHSGEKPFLCSVCPYTTNRASNLKTHERRHKTTVKKGGRCKMCNFNYFSAKEYRQHLEEKHGIKATLTKVPKVSKTTIKQESDKQYSVPKRPVVVQRSNIQMLVEHKPGVKGDAVQQPLPVFQDIMTKSSEACDTPVIPNSAKSNKQQVAIERRMPRSAIIAEVTASGDIMLNEKYPAVPLSLSSPQKYTQVLTTPLYPSSAGKLVQNVLQTKQLHSKIVPSKHVAPKLNISSSPAGVIEKIVVQDISLSNLGVVQEQSAPPQPAVLVDHVSGGDSTTVYNLLSSSTDQQNTGWVTNQPIIEEVTQHSHAEEIADFQTVAEVQEVEVMDTQ